MIRLLDTNAILADIEREKLLYDKNIWENARRLLDQYDYSDKIVIPVVNESQEIICYAYEDKEANRELRMLFELQQIPQADNFRTLHEDITEVVIYGCNELAYHFVRYLKALGITVQTVGKHWKLFGLDNKENICTDKTFKIYAEGVEKYDCHIQELFLRSASVEFECIDEIYESNLRKGIVRDNDGNFDTLVKRLKDNEVVICGVGTESQDAYDLLYSVGIDIVCFMSDRTGGKLLGKPVYARKDIETKLVRPIFIECTGRHSAVGEGGEVDEYAYMGYARNKQYILLKDYTNIPVSGLQHILADKNVMLFGERLLCNRIKKYLIMRKIVDSSRMICDMEDVSEDAICLFVIPPEYLSARYKKYYEHYQRQICEKGIVDYTDYYSRTVVLIQLLTEENKYTCRRLQPRGIIIGCSAAYSGNTLLNNIFDNHPNIMIIPEYNFLSKQLFSVCIRLAEEKASLILDTFWSIYEEEAGASAVRNDFPNREAFCSKMESLLQIKDRFTSQELFVMLFAAYESMYNREFDITDTYIYWEPHQISREISKKYVNWFFQDGVHAWLFRLVRNNCSRCGSTIKDADLSYQFIGRDTSIIQSLLTYPAIEIDQGYADKTLEYRFEDIKQMPRQVLENICGRTGIPWADTFLETTMHGQESYYHGNVTTGFDLKPVYNTFEKYLSEYDRMRISLLSSPFQQKYSYPFVDYRDFSRRELQEMFLKPYRVEKFLNLSKKDILKYRLEIHRKSAELLWHLRCQEIYDSGIEAYGGNDEDCCSCANEIK